MTVDLAIGTASECKVRIPDHFEISRGHASPLGASLVRGGANFAIYSRHATGLTLLLFQPDEDQSVAEFHLDARYNRTGDIWHIHVGGVNAGLQYGWKAAGPPEESSPGRHFDSAKILIDPYSKALTHKPWGDDNGNRRDSVVTYRDRRSCVVDDSFDWGFDSQLNRHLADTIIYEMHVRGFTRHPSSGVVAPGTFLGIIEKIPHLKELGITAVELMPVTEFEELDNPHSNPLDGAPLLNFWGYHPINFFSPKSSYTSCTDTGAQVNEFKTMVRALHDAGIEVILDMVFNHTAEGDERGPTLNFKGLDNEVYYLLDPKTGGYQNFSGCGNTLNCNHPIVRDMIIASLRYWVREMHVDGFRFDLASILGRGRDGSVLRNPPLLERIAADPLLANTKLIAEAWDAAGLYQVGTFPNWGRWAEWNGRFRDDVRAFVKSDPGCVPALATRLAGSADLYEDSGRAPYHSINFLTSHDGFTLADMVSYNTKHNEANGEKGADGHSHNLSWNCGVEGNTKDPFILSLRRRQMKNLATYLLISQGVPMILAGDEFGRSQRGNNNAYCQDNETSWVDWSLKERNSDLFRFFKLLIQFRKENGLLRQRAFFGSPECDASVRWHGRQLSRPDWRAEARTLGMHLSGTPEDLEIYMLCNASWRWQRFELPVPHFSRPWRRFIDTTLEPPNDICEAGRCSVLQNQQHYPVGPRGVVVLISQ